MQVHPDGGGLTLHQYPGVEDDYFSADDYHYNSNAFPRQSIQMVPDQRAHLPKQNAMRDYYYYNNNGSSMQRSPDVGIPLQKHDYNYLDGYGGYDQENENFNLGRRGYGAQYPQAGKEQQYNAWKRNGYPAYGNYAGSMSSDAEMSSAYRNPIKEQRPYYAEQYKAPPVWFPKGIID